jgi:2-iminobutanoate/2-iminopropanoate deaminase
MVRRGPSVQAAGAFIKLSSANEATVTRGAPDGEGRGSGMALADIIGCLSTLREEQSMITKTLRTVLGLALLGLAATALASAPAAAQNQHMEIIHHPNYDQSVFMPFVPALKIKSGKILWLAGTTALPVYHDHPHKRDQIQQYMTGNLEEQTKRTMDGIKATLEAAGASFKDVVHIFVFRARPQMGDIGRASRVINSYFAPYNHKPTSTNIAVLELGEPEQLIEIQAFAVVD